MPKSAPCCELGAEPVHDPSEGWEATHACPSCGWGPKVIHILETVVHNREEAAEMRTRMKAQGDEFAE